MAGRPGSGRDARAANRARLRALASWSATRAPRASRRSPRGAPGVPRVLVASVQALFQHTLAPAELPEQPLELQAAPAHRPRSACCASWSTSATRRCPRSPAAASSRAAAASSTCSRPASRCPSASSGSATRSSRCAPSTRPTSAASRPVDEIELLPASEFLLGADAGERLRERLGRRPTSCPRTLADRPGAARAGPARRRGRGLGRRTSRRRPALDHLGDEIWVVDEPADVDAAADFLWTQADERRAELERAGELPKGWPTAYPEPARLEAAPQRGADARADLGERGRRRAAGRQSVRLARAGPAADADRRPGRDGRALAARGRCASCSRRDQSARLSEILARGRHRRRADRRARARRRRRAASR